MIDIKITRLGTDNSISLATGNSPFKVSGINKLIQQIVKMILTTPGTDMWNPGIGAGVKRILTMNSSNENAKFVCGQIAISIKDTGNGISHNDIQKIFDPFYTSKDSGTGLGLSVVHGIIEKHHGKIEISSKINEGTEFKIYL